MPEYVCVYIYKKKYLKLTDQKIFPGCHHFIMLLTAVDDDVDVDVDVDFAVKDAIIIADILSN